MFSEAKVTEIYCNVTFIVGLYPGSFCPAAAEKSVHIALHHYFSPIFAKETA